MNKLKLVPNHAPKKMGVNFKYKLWLTLITYFMLERVSVLKNKEKSFSLISKEK